MTLEQLRIFVAVAGLQHVTQAARELHLTQSAVSAAITALESRYAVRLFDRIGRRIALTEAGRAFLEEARAILARAADAEAVLADLADFRRGELTVAASHVLATGQLPGLPPSTQDNPFGDGSSGLQIAAAIARHLQPTSA